MADHIAKVRVDAPAAEFVPFPIGPELLLAGDPCATVRWLHASAEGETPYYVGLWRAQPSRFRWTFDMNETAHVLEGRLRVTDEAGAVHEYGPGDVAFFPRGTRTTWEIVEPFLKLFVDA